MSALKGLNGLLGAKRGRAAWGVSAERAQNYLNQIQSGVKIVSGKGTDEEKTKPMNFVDLVDRACMALRAGATPAQIREAGKELITKANTDQWRAPQVKEKVYDFAKSKGVSLTKIAATFDLEDEGTVVVPSAE